MERLLEGQCDTVPTKMKITFNTSLVARLPQVRQPIADYAASTSVSGSLVRRTRRVAIRNTTTATAANAASASNMVSASRTSAIRPSTRPSHQIGKFESEANRLYFVAAD